MRFARILLPRLDSGSPEAVIRYWHGRSKCFATKPFYVSVAVAAAGLTATVAVVASGFIAAMVVIFGWFVVAVVAAIWVLPPATCELVSMSDVVVGDLVAAAEDDLMLRVAPVVAISMAQRDGREVIQIGTAAGVAYEGHRNGALPVLVTAGFLSLPAKFQADRQTAWNWSDAIWEIVSPLLAHQRSGSPAPTKEQVQTDLVARLGYSPASGRYAMLAAAGLGLITDAQRVVVTPAGAVWHSSRWHGLGDRIDAQISLPTEVSVVGGSVAFDIAPASTIALEADLIADVSDSARGRAVIDLSGSDPDRASQRIGE